VLLSTVCIYLSICNNNLKLTQIHTNMSTILPQIHQRGVSLYRQLFKTVSRLVTENQAENRSNSVKQLIPDQEIQQYILTNARKSYKLTQRQLLSGKIDHEDIIEMHKQLQWVVIGLKEAIKHATHPTHKKKLIRQSPFFSVLTTAITGWGNDQYRSALIECFVDVAQYTATYSKLPQLPIKEVPVKAKKPVPTKKKPATPKRKQTTLAKQVEPKKNVVSGKLHSKAAVKKKKTYKKNKK
jgi:hypothetical protein